LRKANIIKKQHKKNENNMTMQSMDMLYSYNKVWYKNQINLRYVENYRCLKVYELNYKRSKDLGPICKNIIFEEPMCKNINFKESMCKNVGVKI
jgi:hypothetical protein